MVSLSEKAKGKQRAIQIETIDTQTEQVQPEPPYREFTVRFTDGIPDLIVQVTKTEHVRDVKEKVGSVLLSTGDTYLTH